MRFENMSNAENLGLDRMYFSSVLSLSSVVESDTFLPLVQLELVDSSLFKSENGFTTDDMRLSTDDSPRIKSV